MASPEENEAKTRHLYDAVWNERKLELIDEWVTEDFIGHHTAYPKPIVGADGFRTFVNDLLTAVPDLRMDVHDTISSGDRVASRITASGTHAGELFGYAPTGLSVATEFIGIERYVDGRCAEEWVNSDDLGLARQIKALPAPGSRAERLGMRVHALAARRLRKKSGY
jgi:predicted ester cyclase